MSYFFAVLFGAVITHGGYLAGRLRGNIKVRQQTALEVIKAICDCKHPLAEHDPKTGACHHVDHKSRGFGGDGLQRFEQRPCNCRQYIGPRPFEMFTLPTE